MGSADMACLPACFDLLLWNMQKCRGIRWRDDFLHLIADRHLLLLQEASIQAVNVEIFDQHEEYFWTMARSFRHLKSESESGVKSGCRCMPLETNSYSSPNFEPLIRTHKMLLQTVYPLESSQPLMVLNVHALNFSRIKGYKRQLAQIAMAARNHQGPMIFAGDFNTWSKQRYQLLRQLAEELGLTEALISRKTKARHLYRHLDHLFYRQLKLENIELLESVTSSDHLPITARFSTI